MALDDRGQALVHGLCCLVVQVEHPVRRTNFVDVFDDFTAHLYYHLDDRVLKVMDVLELWVVAVGAVGKILLRRSEVLEAEAFVFEDLFAETR